MRASKRGQNIENRKHGEQGNTLLENARYLCPIYFQGLFDHLKIEFLISKNNLNA